ncbi:MAG: hypothetical protein FJ100_08545 [Deltaproteobacteria bacterium]|nr:hypothetical protein [Deltaproteobacteria bacterium]
MTNQPPQQADLLLYRTPNDTVRIEALHEPDTSWLDQRRAAKLFGVDVGTGDEHPRRISASGELTVEATIRKFRMDLTCWNRDVLREVGIYNLDAIISAAAPRTPTARTMALAKERQAAIIAAAVTGQLDPRGHS